MKTDRELMQQALEALDAYSWEQVDAARTALRAALEEPGRKPLTDEEIRRIKPVSPDLVDFRSGVRCAERAHGIGSE